ncbi:Uncharacterised protein [Chlamydia trachomatis]|nr:Uncharacterised protein [Chlamydia trachomatis]
MNDSVKIVFTKNGGKSFTIENVCTIKHKTVIIDLRNSTNALDSSLARIAQIVNNHNPIPKIQQFNTGMTTNKSRPTR